MRTKCILTFIERTEKINENTLSESTTRITDIEKKVVIITADINGRIFLVEEKVNETNKSVKTLFSTNSDKVEQAKVIPVDNSCKHEIKSLEEEIRKIVELSNARFKDYENFKDVFKKDVEPILDRINNAYMGNPINPSQVGAVVPEQVLSQVEVNNVPYRRNGVINSPSYQETSNRRNRNGEQIDCEVLFLTDSNLHK